jgi:hypothetical protein
MLASRVPFLYAFDLLTMFAFGGKADIRKRAGNVR